MTTLGVLAEGPAEPRVALVPQQVGALVKKGLTLLVERGAGVASGFPDDEYVSRGALVCDRREVLAAEVVVAVRTTGTGSRADVERLVAELRPGLVLVGLGDPLGNPQAALALADAGVTSFALELLPRTTRAQAMDVLSSQAALAGYQAAVLSAQRLNRTFPMMSTAAGTLAPAKVLVVGAGVAGLSALATARRLGAVVSAYDVRPEAKEQVQSVGATFVELELDATAAAGEGGYAADAGEAFLRRQRELLASAVAGSDVVITTAQVPGRKAPLIVTADMVRGMSPGSIVVDIAAAQGGNCELTRPDEVVDVGGVQVHGPTNLAGEVPADASRLYAKNIASFLGLVLTPAGVAFDTDDVLVAGTLVTHGGAVVHPAVRDILGLPMTAEAPARAAADLVPTAGG